jgi:CRISPR-associated protein Cas2
MVVVVLERVPSSLRGYLSRWMLEIQSGVYVGDLGNRVRENLWEELCCHTGTGSAFIVFSTDDEQGFRCEFWGVPSRRLRDFDGLQLVEIYDVPASQAKHAKRIWTTTTAEVSPKEKIDF